MDRGVIYSATGPDYLDLAIQSARSLKAVEPDLPIDVFTDRPDDLPQGLFDGVHTLLTNHPREKLRVLPCSRFERTLYLDCDTLIVAPLGDLFDLLDRFDFALAHDVRRNSDLIKEGLEHKTPYAFPQLNSGVMLYRTSPRMKAFFREWAQRFFEAAVSRDQIILKDLLWETDLRFYVLPPEFNLRRVTVLDAWEPLDATPTIIHSHRFMDHMQRGAARVDTLEGLVEVERRALEVEWSGDLPQGIERWQDLRQT